MKNKILLICVFVIATLSIGTIYHQYYNQYFYYHKPEFNEVVIERNGYVYKYYYDIDRDHLFIPPFKYYKGTTGSFHKAVLAVLLAPGDCIPWIFKTGENEYRLTDCDLVNQKMSQAVIVNGKNKHMTIMRQMQELAYQKWPDLDKWAEEAKKQ